VLKDGDRTDSWHVRSVASPQDRTEAGEIGDDIGEIEDRSCSVSQ
jgi:hypothetical protein